jgi:hypothetical protein
MRLNFAAAAIAPHWASLRLRGIARAIGTRLLWRKQPADQNQVGQRHARANIYHSNGCYSFGAHMARAP